MLCGLQSVRLPVVSVSKTTWGENRPGCLYLSSLSRRVSSAFLPAGYIMHDHQIRRFAVIIESVPLKPRGYGPAVFGLQGSRLHISWQIFPMKRSSSRLLTRSSSFFCIRAKGPNSLIHLRIPEHFSKFSIGGIWELNRLQGLQPHRALGLIIVYIALPFLCRLFLPSFFCFSPSSCLAPFPR